jgi:hypothetical protein
VFGRGHGLPAGVEYRKAEAQAAPASGSVDAHRELDMGRADFSGHAGGSGRALDAGVVEPLDQIESFAAIE